MDHRHIIDERETILVLIWVGVFAMSLQSISKSLKFADAVCTDDRVLSLYGIISQC